jgi:hypothetical protein
LFSLKESAVRVSCVSLRRVAATRCPRLTRGVLKVLDHMMEQGDYEELRRVIERQGDKSTAFRGVLERGGTEWAGPV